MPLESVPALMLSLALGGFGVTGLLWVVSLVRQPPREAPPPRPAPATRAAPGPVAERARQPQEAPAPDAPPAPQTPPAAEVPRKSAAPAPEPAPVAEPAPELSWFTGLRRTRDALLGRLDAVLRGGGALDQEALDEIETVLFSADLGTRTADDLMEVARGAGSPGAVRGALRARALELLQGVERPAPAQGQPHVVLMVGVNGSGKTTTVGKLAHRFQRGGHSVVVAAADTYRAAAIEQLGVWAERAGVQIVKGAPGADPASVAFDAAQAAREGGIDVVIVDSAGRLQTDVGLMDQLRKISRVLGKEIPDAPHDVLLVLDANTGQNAIRQAKQFEEAVAVSAIVLTKLDGTAKGGVVLGIAQELGLPVRHVGTGEGMADLADFDSERFVDALFAQPDEAGA